MKTTPQLLHGSRREFDSAALLLRAVPLVADHVAIDEETAGIDWEHVERLRDFLSSGEVVLVDLARTLWSMVSYRSTIVEALSRLDSTSWALVIEALQIRRPIE